MTNHSESNRTRIVLAVGAKVVVALCLLGLMAMGIDHSLLAPLPTVVLPRSAAAFAMAGDSTVYLPARIRLLGVEHAQAPVL